MYSIKLQGCRIIIEFSRIIVKKYLNFEVIIYYKYEIMLSLK